MEELRQDIARERELLDRAQGRAAVAQTAQETYNRQRQQNAAWLAPERERLSAEVAQLRILAETFTRHERRISDAWSNYLDVLVAFYGGGMDGLDEIARLVTGTYGGVSGDERETRKLGSLGAQRLDLARGWRRELKATEYTDLVPLMSLCGLLRQQWQDAVPADMPAAEFDPASPVGQVLQHLRRSTAFDSDLDAVHAWHPLPWAAGMDPHTPLMQALGAGLPPAGEDDPPVAVQTLPDRLRPDLPAATRRALAGQSPQDTEALWRPRLEELSALNRAGRRIPTPWSPPPRYPQPSDAVSVQHWYTAAAIGTWSRLTETANATGQQLVDAAGTAIAMACCAPYWLPTGQTAGYVDSRPLSGQDIDDIRLPYPQTLVVMADPLLLPAGGLQRPDPEMSEWLLQQAEGRSPADLHEVPCPDPPPSWDTLLGKHGARVEAVLLLGDLQGHLDDVFAWCLALPSPHGGVIGRIIVPARRSLTRYAPQIANLAAVAAWADWHTPLPAARSPQTPAGLGRRQPHTGNGVHVLNAKRTASTAERGTDTAQYTVRPHMRRGHWHRYRHGPGRTQVKRLRIAPTPVNSRLGPLTPRVYRLPSHLGDAVREPLPDPV
jgi:hypothetical protein